MNNLTNFALKTEMENAKKEYGSKPIAYDNAFEDLAYERQLEEIILSYRRSTEKINELILKIKS